MSRLATKLNNLTRRRNRVRSTITGTSERPRLSVFVSNRHVSAQLIDDSKHHTIAQVTTASKAKVTGTLTEQATWVGTEIAKKAKTAKITTVVFDRGGKLYHGRVKALADAARAGGLEF